MGRSGTEKTSSAFVVALYGALQTMQTRGLLGLFWRSARSSLSHCGGPSGRFVPREHRGATTPQGAESADGSCSTGVSVRTAGAFTSLAVHRTAHLRVANEMSSTPISRYGKVSEAPRRLTRKNVFTADPRESTNTSHDHPHFHSECEPS